jgi:Ca-activated chloride channel family protein
MTFAYPAVLILLALPVLLLVWECRRRGTVLAMPFDHSGARRGRWLEGIVKIANLGAPLLLAVAVVLLAGPQRPLSQGNQRVLTNIEFVLDVSGSMTATFGDGRRSDKAVEALQEFVGHREGDAFGVTLFGTEVLHWVPLTQDLSALKHSRQPAGGRPDDHPDFRRHERRPARTGGQDRRRPARRRYRDVLHSRG